MPELWLVLEIRSKRLREPKLRILARKG